MFAMFLACGVPAGSQPVLPEDVDTEPVDTLPDLSTPEQTHTPPDRETPTAEAAFLRGSWVSHIKAIDADPGNAHCQEGGWFTNDTAAQRDALLESGQDLYVGYVYDGDTSDCWFLNFDRMLDTVTPDDGLQIAAGAKTAQSLQTYLDLIAALRLRAAEHPELTALLIDDFQGEAQTATEPDHAFSAADTAAMFARAHETDCSDDWCAAPPIALWLYFTFDTAAEVVMPAVVLSEAGDGFSLSVDEETPLTLLLSGAPTPAQLRLSDDAGVVQEEDLETPGALRQLTFTLPAGTSTLSMSGTGALTLWGMRLGEEDVDVETLALTGGAQTNAPWRIDDSLDALLLHQIDFPENYDPDVFADAFAVTCRHLGERGCYMGLWGNDQWRTELSLADQAERVAVAEDVADGLIIFRYPLDLHGGTEGPPARGIYAEPVPFSDEYDLMGYWPAYTRGVPGFSHAWEAEVPCDGDYTLHWSDNDGISGRFVKTLHRIQADGSGLSEYRADIGSDGGSGTHSFSATAGERLRLAFTEIESVGNVEVYAQYRVEAPDGCALTWAHSAAVDPLLWDTWRCYEALLHGEVCAGG